MQRLSVAQILVLSTYLLGCVAIIYTYAIGWHIQGFYLSTVWIILGAVLTVASIRRYRQRLNYVEGLEVDPSLKRDLSLTHPLLKSHWIDFLGDQGVGMINLFLILIAIPGVLGHASLLPQMALFNPPPVESHGFGFGTWVLFVVLDSVGALQFVLKYFGLEYLSQLGELSEQFSSQWHWFMLMVQLGLLSLAFDIFRRYLDLSTLLDRLVSSISMSSRTFIEHENELNQARLDHALSEYDVEEQFKSYLQQKNDSVARIETLARFLCVFPKKRLVFKVVKLIQKSHRWWRHQTLSEESRSSLLTALSIASMRSQKNYTTKLTHQTAFQLLKQPSSIRLRIKALDVLSGLHAKTEQERPNLSDSEKMNLIATAKNQLKAGSIHAISTDCSIGYEELCLAASFALCIS